MHKRIGLAVIVLFLLILGMSALEGGNIGIGNKPVAREEQLQTVLSGIEGEEVCRYAHYEDGDNEIANLYLLFRQEAGYEMAYVRPMLQGGVHAGSYKARYVYDLKEEWLFERGESRWRKWNGKPGEQHDFDETGLLYMRTLWYTLEDGTKTEPILYWGLVPEGAVEEPLLFSEEFGDTGLRFVVFETEEPLVTEIPVIEVT